MQVHPSIISADVAYDVQKIRHYNRKRRIKSSIPTNPRSRVHLNRGRSHRFDPILYRERGVIERFFSGIEVFKKIVPRYERYEHSFIGLIHLACAIMIWRVMG